MQYRHTQTNYSAWLGAFVVLLALVVAAAGSGESPGAAVAIGALLIILAAAGILFSRLTVTVDAEAVQAAFGWGWPRRSIEIGDITAVRQVRNKWYYGWGLRKVPSGWMYNVWGLDAVELDLTSGKKFRIGTDEPAELLGMLSLYR
jgi:hypothetical protein